MTYVREPEQGHHEHDHCGLHRHVEAERHFDHWYDDLGERLDEGVGHEEEHEPSAEHHRHEVLEPRPMGPLCNDDPMSGLHDRSSVRGRSALPPCFLSTRRSGAKLTTGRVGASIVRMPQASPECLEDCWRNPDIVLISAGTAAVSSCVRPAA